MSSDRASAIIVAGTLILAATVAAQTGPAQDTARRLSLFPPGAGRDALFKVCQDCHGPESVLGHWQTRDEWKKTLDEMATNGAQGSDEEWTQIEEYLVKYYSLIFVNTATSSELASTLDVPADAAEAIVRVRSEQGGLKTVDDLKRVSGIAAATIDARKDRLVF